MKICKNCKTRMDDVHTVCPECNCEEFETEKIVNDNAPEKPEDATKDDSPTRIIDTIKENKVIEADESDDDVHEDYNQAEKALTKKIKPWQIGFIISAAVVVIGVVIAVITGAFSETNRYYNNAKVETPSDVVTEPVKTDVKNTSYVMTEEPFDMQIKIEKSVYQLPMMVKDVLASGWSLGDTADSEIYLASGEVYETYFVSTKGTVIFATVKNFDKNEAALKDCCLIGLKVDADCLAGEKILLVKNLTMGSLRTAVEAVFGECDDVTEENKGTTLIYTRSINKYASFVFDAKTKKLISVAYFNDAVPDEFESAEPVTEADKNEEKDDSVPTALGNDIASGVMQIEGDLYKFPILVSHFLDNGWEITFEEDRAILFGEEHLFGTLKKGDVEITGVDVYNFEKGDCRIKNCYVVSIEASTDSPYSIVLPKNVKVGMSEEDFLSAINGAAYDFDSTYFNEYIFTRGAYSLVIDVDKDDKTIMYWYADYDVAYED